MRKHILTLCIHLLKETPIRPIQFRKHVRDKHILMMQHQSRPYLARPEFQPLHFRHSLFSIASSLSFFLFCALLERELLLPQYCSSFPREGRCVLFSLKEKKAVLSSCSSRTFSLYFFSALFLSFLVTLENERETERERESLFFRRLGKEEEELSGALSLSLSLFLSLAL